jgi:hypothetical protein
MGRVIERGETTIGDDGLIYHDDKPLTWEEADARAGRRLDRRKAWAFVKGQLCEAISWTQACSGCSYDNGFDARGGGCEECGYHGVRRESMWLPC